MNLQPSTSIRYNERRLLFAQELSFGGHGQVPLTGAGTYVAPADHVFYAIDFFTPSVVQRVVFRNVNADNVSIYTATNSAFNNTSFPAGYTWMAPITSLQLSTGTGIAYLYEKFIPEEIFCD